VSLAFFPAYWTALMFWTEVSLGCLIVTLLQFLTGGRWGLAALPFLRAGVASWFLVLPGFLVLPFAMAKIFLWTAGLPPELAGRAHWLQPVPFLGRTVFYLAAFSFACLAVLRWRRTDPPPWAGPLLVGVLLVVSLASTDWMMSLDPSFASSLYPFLFAAASFVVVLSGLAWLMSRQTGIEPRLLADFGTLLFASVCFWGYIELGQLLIIWTGNLPHEASWYVNRTSLGWRPFTVMLFLLHFALPFALLLSRPLKANPRRLGMVAAGLFLVHYLEVFWMTGPRPGEPLRFDPFTVILPLAMGWIWVQGFRRYLQREATA
jgi:hypothetical protein